MEAILQHFVSPVAWSFQLYRFCGRRRACGALTSGFRHLDLNDFVFKPLTLNPRGRVAVDPGFLHRGHFGFKDECDARASL